MSLGSHLTDRNSKWTSRRQKHRKIDLSRKVKELPIIPIIRTSTYDILLITRKFKGQNGEKELLITRSKMIREDLERQLSAYTIWIGRQPLAENTRRAYLFQVRQYLGYLAMSEWQNDDPLSDPFARDYAVRDYKTYVKTDVKAKPRSVNLALAAIDHFYLFLGMDQARVKREELPSQAPQSLKLEEQKAFLRAVERTPSLRNQAIATLLFYTALRLSECADLNVDDVCISARKGLVVVRSGKGDSYREVPLNTETREVLKKWQKQRIKQFPNHPDPALFLNLKGRRLSTRAIDLIVRHLGTDAKLELSAHILRHTCLTNLVRHGNDLVLVAEVAGHKRLETTRRYSLPSLQDRENAMERLMLEY
jgi:site-specific recombinase XerD